jgi:enamine deaminase RidA (YjgF/YER057c/UK114 family)
MLARAMRTSFHRWHDRDFVSLSGEGRGASAAEQVKDLLQRFDATLREAGLSIENTVRTRLWARDRQSRGEGSTARVQGLSGKARSVSSSYIAPPHFDSEADIALDLIAMRPQAKDSDKFLKEYEPQLVPLRYLTYGPLAFLSGVTAEEGTLAEQVADIIPRIEGSLIDAGSSWDQTAQVSFYLHREQDPRELARLFREHVSADIHAIDYSFADGYSAAGKLVEIEVTGRRS